jgi:uncharacterized protein (TIGR03000 family)
MNQRKSVFLIASVLALVLVATPAFAQRGVRGGGWGGGGWGGGVYHGGYGGWNGGYYHGGWGGYPYYGYGRGYYGGYYPWGLGLGVALGGLGSGYYNNGYYYGDSIYYGTPYVTVPTSEVSINSEGAVLSNYQVQDPATGAIINNSSAPTYARQSFYSAPATSAGKAELTVKVPADAQVWLGTMQSGQTGAERHFSFPALPAGSNVFTVRATFMENGQQVTRDKKVDMKAGGNETVDFTKAGDDKARTNTSTDTAPLPSPGADKKKDSPPLPQTGIPKK